MSYVIDQLPQRCEGAHLPIDDGEDARGWMRVVCGRCKRFIGYKPPDDVKEQIYDRRGKAKRRMAR